MRREKQNRRRKGNLEEGKAMSREPNASPRILEGLEEKEGGDKKKKTQPRLLSLKN